MTQETAAEISIVVRASSPRVVVRAFRRVAAATGLHFRQAAGLAAALLCVPVLAGPVVVLDEQLRARTVDLVRIAGERGTLTYREIRPVASSEPAPDKYLPLSRVLAIIECEAWTAESGARREWRSESWRAQTIAERAGLGLLELVDGTRIVGSLDAGLAEETADSVAWAHRTIGEMLVNLERVVRVRMDGPAAETGAATLDPTRDAVLLANDDAILGFVERIGAEVWTRPSAQGTPVKTPMSRVREVRLANPPAPPSGGLAWLSDGSIIAVESATLTVTASEAGPVLTARVRDSAEKKPLALGVVRALLPDAGRVCVLAREPIMAQQPAVGRIYWRPATVRQDADAPLWLTDIELPGPMSVEWALPARAEHFAGWLVLAEGAREWGDCVVTVEVVEGGSAGATRELARTRLTGAEPSVRLSAGLSRDPKASTAAAPAARLRIRVEPGERGPIQDRVIIRNMIIGLSAR